MRFFYLVEQHYGIGLSAYLFGELACLIVFTAIAALGGRMATWFNRSDRAQMLMNRIAGCIFLGLALMLAFASR